MSCLLALLKVFKLNVLAASGPLTLSAQHHDLSGSPHDGGEEKSKRHVNKVNRKGVYKDLSDKTDPK